MKKRLRIKIIKKLEDEFSPMGAYEFFCNNGYSFAKEVAYVKKHHLHSSGKYRAPFITRNNRLRVHGLTTYDVIMQVRRDYEKGKGNENISEN